MSSAGEYDAMACMAEFWCHRTPGFCAALSQRKVRTPRCDSPWRVYHAASSQRLLGFAKEGGPRRRGGVTLRLSHARGLLPLPTRSVRSFHLMPDPREDIVLVYEGTHSFYSRNTLQNIDRPQHQTTSLAILGPITCHCALFQT